MNEKNIPPQKAFLVGCYTDRHLQSYVDDYLEELASLATTCGFDVCGQDIVYLRQIDAATFIGSGKVEELAERSAALLADIIIFDEEISPNQQKNLEAVFKRPVLDRAGLILEIFAQRAQTREAKLQIELAKIEYMLPRLKRLWTHLSRQKTGGGGGGAVKGEGEKQIEIDRRLFKRRIHTLQQEIKAVSEHRKIQRQARIRSGIPVFAIVGYTNSGKSTLLNKLTEAGVLSENKLFATLDTTVRKFTLPNHQEVLLIDTVGFVRKLPHNLVAAFKSTLEESCYTDLLIHVIDASHPNAFEQGRTTEEVLSEIGAVGKPVITVLNKIDREGALENVARLKLSFPRTVAISLETGEGIESLLDAMMEELARLRRTYTFKIPQERYDLVSKIVAKGHVLEQSYEENHVLVQAQVPEALLAELAPFQV